MNGKKFTYYAVLVKIRDYAGIRRVKCILGNKRLINKLSSNTPLIDKIIKQEKFMLNIYL
jgi:hypothetical protein